MSYPHELLDAIPELQDQRELFEQAVIHESHLSLSHKKLVAWAAALACKDECAVGQVNDTVGNLTRVEQKAVVLASSRMAGPIRILWAEMSGRLMLVVVCKVWECDLSLSCR
jgi:hypothetical protein